MLAQDTQLEPLKIIFAGTPDFAATALKSLLDAGHEICAVYCQPDRKSGRGKKLNYGPVKQLAVELNIPVEQPLNFKQTESVETLASYQADLMIVVAYGLLLPLAVLQSPKFGCVNIHASLLPRWRGAAPIQRAIESGDTESGVTIMQMDQGLDTGAMLLTQKCRIEPNETGSSLHDKLAKIGGQLINDYLNQFIANHNQPAHSEAQNNQQANYANKLSKDEAAIDWHQAAVVIERKIRAFNAWPVCFTLVGDKRLRIWQAEVATSENAANDSHKGDIDQSPGKVVNLSSQAVEVMCGDSNILKLLMLQPDGGKMMSAAALLNSRRDWFIQNPILSSEFKSERSNSTPLAGAAQVSSTKR